MTHCDDGALRAFLDGELAPGARARVEHHLNQCMTCRTQLASVGADAAWVGARLRDHAAATAVEGVPTEVALRRWRAIWGGAADRPRPAPARQRRRGAGSRVWLAPAAAAGLLAGALVLPPVRAMAGDFLQLFRVQQVQVVNVSSTDAAQLEELLKSHGPAVLDVKDLVRVRVTPAPAPVSVSLAEAGQRLPFALAVPQAVPAGYDLSQVQVQPKFRVEINHLNLARINALLASLGSQQQLPSALAQADINLMVPASVAMTYQGQPGQAPIKVLEGGNPSLAVDPSMLDIGAVRNVLLNLPFLPDDLRAQLRAVSDWEHTALIPQLSGVSEAVSVDGTQGAFVHTGDSAGDTALIWFKGDVVYAIQGVLTLPAAQAIATSLK